MTEKPQNIDEIAPFTLADWERHVSRFHHMRYGEWLAESEEDKQLRELGKSYHDRCESYDRTVCTGTHPKTGEAIPIHPGEYGLINQHAFAVRRSVIEEGRAKGFTELQVCQAIAREGNKR